MMRLYRPVTAFSKSVVVASLLLAGALTFLGTHELAAQRKVTAPIPAGVRWCGLADSGGPVRFQLTEGYTSVLYISIQAKKGYITSGEEQPYRAQPIMNGSFIFRRDRRNVECSPRQEPGERCTLAPCKPQPPCTQPPCEPMICRDITTNEMTVRGKFLDPETVEGTYTGIVLVDEQARDARDLPPREARVTGRFIAWPEGTSACP